MSKKVFATLGMIISVVVILMGILAITGSLGGELDYTSSNLYYDTGYATFGADFYTHVNNNTVDAVHAVETVAGNLRELLTLLKNVCGIFLMGFGLFGLCHFGAIRCDCAAVTAPQQDIQETKGEEEIAEDPTEESTEEPATEQNLQD